MKIRLSQIIALCIVILLISCSKKVDVDNTKIPDNQETVDKMSSLFDTYQDNSIANFNRFLEILGTRDYPLETITDSEIGRYWEFTPQEIAKTADILRKTKPIMPERYSECIELMSTSNELFSKTIAYAGNNTKVTLRRNIHTSLYDQSVDSWKKSKDVCSRTIRQADLEID